jgi:hypothetical protein
MVLSAAMCFLELEIIRHKTMEVAWRRQWCTGKHADSEIGLLRLNTVYPIPLSFPEEKQYTYEIIILRVCLSFQRLYQLNDFH